MATVPVTSTATPTVTPTVTSTLTPTLASTVTVNGNVNGYIHQRYRQWSRGAGIVIEMGEGTGTLDGGTETGDGGYGRMFLSYFSLLSLASLVLASIRSRETRAFLVGVAPTFAF